MRRTTDGSPSGSRRPRRTSRRTRTYGLVGLLALGVAATATLTSTAGAETSDSELPRALDRILADERLSHAEASVLVVDAKSGEVRYEHDADDTLMPASNTKLATSAAAMELLGPGHRFRTDVLTDGTVRDGQVDGDLYLRGTGDPTALAEDYDQLAADVAAAGVTRVTGALVADDTRFDDERLGWSWAADDESAYYSAQISALTVAPDTEYDAGTVKVRTTPGQEPGTAPEVALTPVTDYLEVQVEATTVAAGEESTLLVEREHGGNTLTVSGRLAADAAPVTRWISVWEPTGYAAEVFRRALAHHGVEVLGDTRVGQATPDGARSLAEHQSMPLSDLLVPFLKLSNNGHAEVLTKAMGYQATGEGTWDAGIAAVTGYLEKAGVDVEALRQVDGSGLSRMNAIPTTQLVTLLRSVRDASWFEDWYAALPVACKAGRMEGGTLASRLCDTPAENNAHAKTGTLTGVSALSGYVTDADGDQLVFGIVLNNHLAGSVTDIQDSLVATLAAHSDDDSPTVRVQRAPPDAHRATVPGGGVPALELECAWLKPRGC